MILILLFGCIYGEAYSLGLIQAAHLVGESRPILDIIKNREIYNELVANGFQLLKDNATIAIRDRIVSEMQMQTVAGSNPLNVAERLNTLFGNQNSSWERLARTEMALAAETAKTNEWTAWKIKMVEFVPAPDACPICLSLRGDYKIAECPTIPVHPRCRCSKRPAASEAKQAPANKSEIKSDTKESLFQPIINITVPEQKAPEVTVNNAAPQVTVNVPEQPATVVTIDNQVHVPENPAPVVNVENKISMPSPDRKVVIQRDSSGNMTGAEITEE